MNLTKCQEKSGQELSRPNTVDSRHLDLAYLE